MNTSSSNNLISPAQPRVPESGATADVSRLAAKVAHELNNPLDAVLRYVSLAQRKAKLGEFSDIERYLNDAQYGLQKMAEILRDLMEIGREADQIVRKSATLPLPETLDHARRTVASLAEQHRVTLKLLGEVRADVRTDVRLAQVLANLLKNAVEASSLSGASPENVVQIHITVDRSDPASAQREPGSAMLHIDIIDGGPGIPPQIMPRLFTPFVTSKPKGAGHGLGLTISRELMTALGGSLELANRAAPDHGCQATIRLPLNDSGLQ